jgi:DeoR/GlpR family transcriptional regulator of sugar metabolism
MLAEQRRSRLLDLVREQRFAALPALAELLAVSESTVRRDLEQLESLGCAQRIHGGVLYTGTSPMMPHFEEAQSHEWLLKKAVAAKAAELIEERDTILLDGGSTTYEVARSLLGKSLNVVTNSLPVANLFAPDTKSDLVFLGGNICPRSGVARGPYTNQMLSMVRVRKTIFSVAGINEEGFYNNDLLLVETERAMMRAAEEVIVVADSTKIGRQSLSHLCPLNNVQHLVVDDGIDDVWREKIVAAGVKLHIATMKAAENEVVSVR